MKNAILSFVAWLLLSGAALAAPTGKVLILDNELLIEGDIRRDGDRYIIRRGLGETIVPANRVIELVADRPHAYMAMRERCNRHDFDDRMHLVRWCMENGMRDEALAEAESLYRFRPDDTALRVLVEGLRTLKLSKVEPVPAAAPPSKLPGKVLELEPLDYNRESFGLFVARVQPILMNVCARCHATGQGGNFTLVGLNGGDRKAALQNLAATLKQLKKSDPVSSPLLEKAVTPHGKSMQPPLRDRQSPAYENLEAWVRMAVIPDETTPVAPPAPVIVPKPPTDAKTKPAAKKMVFGETSTSQAGPEPQTQARDPFDPAIFNGTIQPKKD